MKNSGQAALFALVVIILVWAYSWIVMKQMMDYIGPFDFTAMRYGLGALILFLMLWLRGESLRPTPLRLTILVGLTQTTGFQAFAQCALVNGGAGHVSVISYTMPFWVILLAWWLLKENPTRRQWQGIALAGIGLLCIIAPWQHTLNLGSALLALLAGISWAFGVVLSKRMFQLHAPSALSFTAWQMAFGAVTLIALALIIPSRSIHLTPMFYYGMAYSVILASSLAWFLWAFVVDRLPTHIAGLSALAIPVVAVLMAWLILAEVPSQSEWLGILCIVAGLYWVSGKPWRRRSRQVH